MIQEEDIQIVWEPVAIVEFSRLLPKFTITAIDKELRRKVKVMAETTMAPINNMRLRFDMPQTDLQWQTFIQEQERLKEAKRRQTEILVKDIKEYAKRIGKKPSKILDSESESASDSDSDKDSIKSKKHRKSQSMKDWEFYDSVPTKPRDAFGSRDKRYGSISFE